jgi:hypothetical protein
MLSGNTLDKDATFYIPNASFSRRMNTAWNTNTWALPIRTEGTFNFEAETNIAEV